MVIVLVVATGVGLVWAVQRSLIYYPDSSPVPPAADALPGARDVSMTTADGVELSAWFAPTPDEVDDTGYAVLVAPGNAGNRLSRVDLADALRERGFAVLLMDYRGYGGNPGSPDEDGLVQDGLAAATALEAEGYPPERTIYFGESLGGGVIALLLSERPPAGAVFRSPFTELAAVGRHHFPLLPVNLLLRDRFPVIEHVEQSDVPVSVVRANQDSVVPTELSAQVAEAAPALVEELVLEGDHNDPPMFGPNVADVVTRLVDALDG